MKSKVDERGASIIVWSGSLVENISEFRIFWIGAERVLERMLVLDRVLVLILEAIVIFYLEVAREERKRECCERVARKLVIALVTVCWLRADASPFYEYHNSFNFLFVKKSCIIP